MRHEAIYNKYPQVTEIRGDGIPRDSNGDEVTIDESVVTTEINRLETEYTNQEYARSRAKEYPLITDQLDDIYHNGIDAWKATIKTTKDKYPKP